MKKKPITLKHFFFLPLLALVLLASCREEEQPVVVDDDDPPAEERNPNVAINEWTQDVMDEVYYWLENMRAPTSLTANPRDYFEALLYKPTDRFSAIYENAGALQDGLGGVNQEAGYEFQLYYWNSEERTVAAVVSYIKKGSPAQGKDLKRGDIILGINGTQITDQNYGELIREMRSQHTITYRRRNLETGSIEQMPDIEMEVTRVAENPNFMDTVYTVNDQKIGYVVYHFFAPSPNPTQQGAQPIYDDEMDQIFSRFKSEGISHLIIDFRYNGGGYVSSAVNLASLIGAGVTSSDVFSKTKYNSFIMSFPQFQNVQTNFRNKPENIGSQLSGNRVYVLASGRTASASELIINSLRPYMDVVIVGTKTYGKNVGSIVVEDEENEDNNWGLMPTISKSFNSRDESEYGTGFLPDIEINEADEHFRPFGDVNEALLRTAITAITGTSPAGRQQFEKLNRREIANTVEFKVRHGVMIDEYNPIKELK
ncbi:PDZ domain-containing protein [Litoribacter alkaliphilus]|uniref:PDZ domain-containing protein n=1 Tax=Litoribacter ruber TaxID=702568 RepID=A0AAP2CKV0_9BACT|nr:S41 family peptidase [Litoribacter alkaliphilus]MBS9525624.1 PDZ domain-containing protein [Litoribacter alkaliphilus]